VWGEGLENPAHPIMRTRAAIIADEATAATRIFGYVDLGVASQNLPATEIETRITRWSQMGADGVLFDHFGYEFATDRARQNAAVDFAHAHGLAVIAIAFQPADAFGRDSDPVYNPSGVASHLGASDYYLYESHGVRLGEYEDADAWRQKSDSLETYRQALGFRVALDHDDGGDGPGALRRTAFLLRVARSIAVRSRRHRLGEFGYSASGMSNGLAPYRARRRWIPGPRSRVPPNTRGRCTRATRTRGGSGWIHRITRSASGPATWDPNRERCCRDEVEPGPQPRSGPQGAYPSPSSARPPRSSPFST
jgi:hypothetical protein